jgi:uncharacterized protein (DUF4415 family)
MPKLKPDHISPSDEEDAAINAGIAADPDTCEVTDEMMARMKPYSELPRPGRPKKPDAKQAVKLRLDPDVLAGFRAQGAGWQSRINQALRQALGLQ